MRKVTRTVCESFLSRQPKTLGNTHTDGNCLWLHGNKIAEHQADGSVELSLASWGTPTTRERVNGVCDLMGLGRPFYQHNHCQYFDNREIGTSEIVTVRRPE